MDEHHGGQMWGESVAGQGASFIFILPLLPDVHRPE
ncbi:hypothetical protein [Magnetospirillum sp. LM-5]